MNADQALSKLAECYGIVASFYETNGREHRTNPETQKALLKANGLTIDGEAIIYEALADIEAEQAQRHCPQELIITSQTQTDLAFGFGTQWQVICADTESIVAEGRVQDQISLPPLRSGVYELSVADSAHIEFINLLVAPIRSPSIADASPKPKHWGVNAALYALRSEQNMGIGNYEDLAGLGEILGANGASFLGINPIHAIGTAAGHVISPYSPSHRGMLNTSHIALNNILGLDQSQSALSARSIAHAASSDAGPFIDYQGSKIIHDECLETMFASFMNEGEHQAKTAFENSEATLGSMCSDFALYETISELHGHDWREWPAALRTKEPRSLQHIRENFENRITYHRWLQWLADTQLSNIASRLKQAHMPLGLYLDLAVGARRGGAESWCNDDAIAQGVSIGAPPDHLSPAGQNWELTAYAPTKLQAQKYNTIRQVLSATMRHAGLLRLDHVLGLNRSFWLPDDGSPGAYITQPFDSFMALIKIEAERSNTIIIGEDLGLVPEGFRDRIRAHGFYGYSVLQYEKEHTGAIRDPAQYEPQLLACFSTHDTPTLIGYCEGRDLDWWTQLGWIDEEEASHARSARAKEVESLAWFSTNDSVAEESPLTIKIHAALARSPASMVSVQLDDVFNHLDAQNLPGTTTEHPNWSRSYAISIEDLTTHPGLHDIAETMEQAGRGCVDPGNASGTPGTRPYRNR